jgi:outer membrane protein
MSSGRYVLLVCALLGVPSLARAQSNGSLEKGQPIDAQSAVRRALGESATLASTRLGTAQAAQDVLVEEGRYPYVFQADAGHTRSASPRLGTDDSVSTSYSRSYTVGTALRRTFPFGTTAEVRLQGDRFESESPGTMIGLERVGNAYGATARASVSQPLLRGAGKDIGELGLRAARQGRVLSEKTQERATSELARDVLLAYWELWYADESLRIEQAALDLARQQETQAKQQQEHGALAPADVYTFSTRVAGLEQNIVSSRLQRQQRSVDLTRLMGSAPNGAPQLVASDAPTPGPLPSASQVEAVLRSGSIELAELEAQLKLARIRADAAGDASKPRLDLDGYLETYGESERPLRAAERAGRFNWLTVHVGATFELPLDGTRHRAEKQSALLAVQIAEHNLKAARDRLAADAVLTVAEARAAEERLVLSERTVKVAELASQAARERFELGGAIAIQVQLAEEEVRRARLQLARTRVDLVQSQIIVQHLAGVLAARYAKAGS